MDGRIQEPRFEQADTRAQFERYQQLLQHLAQRHVELEERQYRLAQQRIQVTEQQHRLAQRRIELEERQYRLAQRQIELEEGRTRLLRLEAPVQKSEEEETSPSLMRRHSSQREGRIKDTGK